LSKDEVRIGGHVQRLRREKGVSQAQLAQALGISPSYLNLIEHNRRRITVDLLLKFARFFGVEAGELAESDKSRLVGDLMEMFGDEMFADFELTNHDIQDMAATNAKLGQAVMRLFDKYQSLRKRGGGAEDMPVDHGQDVATDAVSDFLQQQLNYFPALEAAAERIRHDIDLASESLESGLKTYLYNVLGLRWRQTALADDRAFHLDREGGEILTADVLPSESAIFLVAQQLGHVGAGPEIDRLLAEAALPAEAVPIARDALASYFAAALIMPYDAFHRACMATRYDVERVGRSFKASFEQVCHRMTTLQRPGLAGVPLHLVRADIAGNISKRFSLSGIHIPRHSGACPRWNVYSAFLNPDQINVQVSQMPEGQRYLCIAKSITKGGYRHNALRRHLSIGLGCHIAHASALIYSDGIDLGNVRQTVPIGVGCRVCPRDDCGQRAHPKLQSRAAGAA
jgi:predicted transcriptional regulator/transcriptional regulator with XRE-family HTH domain